MNYESEEWELRKKDRVKNKENRNRSEELGFWCGEM